MNLHSEMNCKSSARKPATYLGGWIVIAFDEQNYTRTLQDFGLSITQ